MEHMKPILADTRKGVLPGRGGGRGGGGGVANTATPRDLTPRLDGVKWGGEVQQANFDDASANMDKMACI